jgi:two-component system OmpR family sensor kinase
VDAFASSLSRHGFTFTVEEDGPAPYVRADSAAIEQALANLLDNAVKYSGDSRVVTVRVRAIGSEARIEVTDRGVGISDADKRRIFEKFFRGAAASLQRQGFGLGLPIVQELVAAHRGRVEVESEVGQGSTFRIILPAHAPVQDAANAAALATSREALR